MASYGKNFEFRIPPKGSARGGRYVAPATALTGSGAGGGTAAGSVAGAGLIPIGAPVMVDNTAGFDSMGRQTVKLVPAGTLTTGVQGEFGLMVYEYGPAAFAGKDPYLTTYSDLDYAPLGAPVQLVHGDSATKVYFRNTAAYNFLGQRAYAGRVMVNGLGATATVAAGDYLVPGNGNDTDGYWQSTPTAAGAWLVITRVDSSRAEVEARLLF
jgi:hypothetical protein